MSAVPASKALAAGIALDETLIVGRDWYEGAAAVEELWRDETTLWSYQDEPDPINPPIELGPADDQ